MKKVAIPMEELMPLLQMQMETSGSASLTVSGVSMIPMLYHRRDSVLLEPVKAPMKRGDLILYRRHNGAYVLHRILKAKTDHLICCGDNQCCREQVLAEQVLAVVTAFTRKGRHYTVQGRGYRCYVALWVGFYPLRWLYLGCRRVLGRMRAAIRRYKRKQST